MTYFKINDVDYSDCVNELKIEKKQIFNSQTNAAGNTVVDKINSKRVVEVGIIPLTADSVQSLLSALDDFSVSISFLNPITNTLEENVSCIIPENEVEYYTIRANNTLLKAFSLKFEEL